VGAADDQGQRSIVNVASVFDAIIPSAVLTRLSEPEDVPKVVSTGISPSTN
jgi:hypothetical protein